MKKTLCSVFALLAVAFVLVGCEKKEEPPVTPPVEPGTNVPAEPPVGGK